MKSGLMPDLDYPPKWLETTGSLLLLFHPYHIFMWQIMESIQNAGMHFDLNVDLLTGLSMQPKHTHSHILG